MALKGRYSDAHLCIQLPIETQVNTKGKESVPLAALFSLSKTTKLILLLGEPGGQLTDVDLVPVCS